MSNEKIEAPPRTIADMVTQWINAKDREDSLRRQLAEAETVTAHEFGHIADAAKDITMLGTSFVVRAWGQRDGKYDMHTVIIELNEIDSVNVDFINDMTEKALGK